MTIRAVVAEFVSLETTDHLEQDKRVQRRNAGLTWGAAKIGGGNNSESERDGGVEEEIKERWVGGVGFRDLQRTGWRAKQGGGGEGGGRKGKKEGTEHRVAQRLNGLHEGPLSTQTAPETQ
ncbi:uncharacterized protein BO87DRAFT_392709 [Aspergillus neoniger CBS 115656]|uniref:Uncharacterized protein n=1 Tax=Aspergillus neoniger (strain CBS 115656) TaxID=1448310 RepID=A0A318YVY9_ASPNB|nr:hypothetical protein BO87DRAFT_392709 [Aspergillus neoniger CBS 115656]PYH39035.1 hypothetical protein BO87DRAFT_392709 [Aspergillus neoniger CBS 115656]